MLSIKSLSTTLITATLIFSGFSVYSVAAQTQSIANPNWWKKPSGVTPLANKSPKTMSAAQIKQVKQEPVSNFLQLPQHFPWQIIGESIGIASAKYQWNFAQKAYEISVIRMNNKVPLTAVLSIWQDKAGLSPTATVSSETITTNHQQKLIFYTLAGAKKTILLAVHQGHKYTFFRLLSEQKVNEKMIKQFKNDLKKIVIVR